MTNFEKKLFSLKLLKFKENLSAKYYKALYSTTKEILKNELKKDRPSFLILTHTLQDYDSYSADWGSYIRITENYLSLYEELLKIKEDLLEESIKKEIEVINFKLENLDEYLEYLTKRENEHYSFWEEILKDKRVSLEGGLVLKEVKKEEVVKNLKYILNVLENKEKLSKTAKNKDYNFEIINLDSSDPFYYDLFTVSWYLTDKEKFRNDFLLDFPILEKKEDIKSEKLINLIRKHKVLDNTDTSEYLHLTSPIIEVMTELKKKKKNTLEIIKKNKKKDLSNLFNDELKEIVDAEELFKELKKEKKLIQNLFFQDKEHNNIFYLSNWSVKNLYEVIKYTITNKYDIKSTGKNSKFKIKINFLNY